MGQLPLSRTLSRTTAKGSNAEIPDTRAERITDKMLSWLRSIPEDVDEDPAFGDHMPGGPGGVRFGAEMRSALARLWLKVVELTNPPHLSLRMRRLLWR